MCFALLEQAIYVESNVTEAGRAEMLGLHKRLLWKHDKTWNLTQEICISNIKIESTFLGTAEKIMQ